MLGYLTVICVFVVSSETIQVPTSWKDEQVFLPYYGVVDGSPRDKNVDTYYPLVASNSVLRDQVVQNDEVIKLFQKMNPNLTILFPHAKKNPTVAAPNNNYHIYSQPAPFQNVNSNGPNVNFNVVSVKLPLKKSEPILEEKSSRNKPEPFKLKNTYHENYDKIDHENPGWIPSKPIYPGEGQWAKKGIEHKPHITKNVFQPLQTDEEPSPGTNFYNKQKNKFQDEYKHFPKKYKLQYPEESSTKDEDYEETTPEEFVPYRTYAQVRHTESEKHVPRKKSHHPRLRESVKDSKIHTLYTEEGYEDSAYDHGDQEKNAESTDHDDNKNKNKTESHKKIIEDPEETVKPPEEPLSPLDYEENTDESSNEEDNSEEDSINDDVEKNLDRPNSKSNSSDLSKELFVNSENTKEVNENKDGSESTNSDDIIVKFDSKRTKNAYNEDALIDSVMDESKFGKKIRQRNRARRSAKVDSERRDINQKYPYYNSKRIDPLSSLRYAENSDNIPKKIDGSMSFYDKADKIDCPEMGDVDPVPDRVKNAESNSVPKNSENQPHSTKLNNLGDQIDCLKARYFGEDPFDNPLFKEDIAEQPSSIFKQLNFEDAARFSSDIVTEVASPVENISVSDNNNNNNTEETLPQALPYVIRRFYRHPPPRYLKRNKVYSKPHQRPQQKRQKNIGPPPSSTRRTPLKNFERISEVHYKDEIKPSEQMNVFSDIINNIKNSSKDVGVAPSNVRPVIIKVHANKNTPSRKRYRLKTSTSPPIQSDIVYEDQEESNNRYYSRLSSTEQPLYYTPDNQIYEEVPKRYHKRKRIPQVTTEAAYIEEITEKVKVKKRRIRPEYTPNSNSPPNTFNSDGADGFTPMLEDVDAKETNHKPQYHEIEKPVMNQYHYIGMRPPPEVPHVHSTYYLKNNVKRRRKTSQPLRKRFVRSTRRGYAEIPRGRQRQEEPKVEEVEKQDEEDDYVPHRARNFHYDEKTGKIVYDKKPDDEKEEDVEYDYVEVEEPTHPPPPKKEVRRIWPTKYPDGPNYLDFIKKLKEDSTYIQILDPLPTEKPKEDASSTTTTKTTSSTGLPDYLAILNKVRTDKSYTFIEDPTEKSKTKITTPNTLEEEDELVNDASEEYIQEEDIQNSPGAQGVFHKESQLQISDTSDSTPSPRNYNPKTSIDTSKYTNIQRRPTTRNRISSKYNSETLKSEESVAEASTKDKKEKEEEFVSTTTLESFIIDIPTTSIPSTTPVRTTERTIETTKAKRVLISRRRGTTITSSTTENATRATTSRRQRGRNRFSTTTTTEAPIQEVTRSRRYLQRRNYANSLVPRNHKPQYSEAQNVQNIKPTPRSITVSLLKQTDFTNVNGLERNNGSNIEGSDNKSKLESAEVDKNQRVDNETKYEKPKIEAVINIPGDKRQPEEDIEQEDEKTKTGDVEVFKDYDKNERHGGNYKYEKVQSEKSDTNSTSDDDDDVEGDTNERNLDDVDAFKDYDKDQKHGGNYKYKKVQIKITRNYRPYSKETREVNDGSDGLTEDAQEPDSYYADSKLPSRINNLKEGQGDLTESDYEDQNLSTEKENDFYEDIEVANTRTKNQNIPNYIRDPSKRLYYYAPV